MLRYIVLALLIAVSAQAEFVCQVCQEVQPTPTATPTIQPTPIPEIVFRPTVFDGILKNPGIGFQTTQKPLNEVTNPRNLPSSSEVFRFYAEEVNPSPGMFTWGIIDNAIAKARAAGQTLNIRFIMYDPYGGSWLRNVLPGNDFTKAATNDCKNEGMGTHFAPDFDQQSARNAVRSLLQAFANRYNSNPTIEHIDIGVIGAYAEWHHWCLVKAGTTTPLPMPSEAAAKEIVEMHRDIFPNKKLVFVLDGDAARKYGRAFAGWRADGWGNPAHTNTLYPNWLSSPVDLADQWKIQPVMLEPFGTFSSWETRGWNAMERVDWALSKHVSLINSKNGFNYPSSQDQAMAKLLKYAGYRYLVDDVRIRPNSVTVNWRNVGVAPCYEGYKLSVKVGGEVQERDACRLPGIFSDTLGFHLPAGKFPVKLAITQLGTPIIKFANVERDADGWMTAGTMEVR